MRSVRELLDEARATEAGDLARARALVQQARVLARSTKDQAAEAEALYRLATISYNTGKADESFAIALEARELARKCRAVVVEVWSLGLIGIVHYNAANYSEALACSLKALELYRTTDHRTDEGNLLNTVAAIHHSLGDTDRAIVTYEAALTANKNLDRPEIDAVTLANMAKVRAERNENLLAVSLGEQALELARGHAHSFVPAVLAYLAEAYASLEMFDRALICLDDAEATIIAGGDPSGGGLVPSMLAVKMARGQVAMARGERDTALGFLTEVLELSRRASMPEATLRAHQLLAQVCKELGRFEEALVHQEARFQLNEDLFNRGTDLRIRTLQIAHDTEAARSQAEILRLRTGELEALVRGRTHDLEEYQLEAFQRLAALAEFGDSDTGEHTVQTGDLSADIAVELGCEDDFIQRLRLAARLHDIGKMAVPDQILLKAGPLTVEEFEVMKTHTTIGASILAGSTSALVQMAADIARSHHERWDGQGYPAGQLSSEIPLEARIVAVADVFDALVKTRTYKYGWDDLDAVRYIIGATGTQFDPSVVDAFVAVMRRRDGRLGEQVPPPTPW